MLPPCHTHILQHITLDCTVCVCVCTRTSVYMTSSLMLELSLTLYKCGKQCQTLPDGCTVSLLTLNVPAVLMLATLLHAGVHVSVSDCAWSSVLTPLFQGYLRALGMKRTAEVKRDARIGEAEAQRDAGIKVKDK